MDYLINLDGQATHGTGFGLLSDVAATTLWWFVVQLFCNKFPDLSSYNLSWNAVVDMRNRQMCFVHGLTILILSAYQTLFIFSECGDPTTPYEHFVLTLSSGFFIFDTLAMAWYGLLDREMLVHHAVCVFNLSTNLIQGVGANYSVLALFVAEISNPAMNTKNILRAIGKRYTRAYEFAEYSYFVTFFFGRFILGHPALYSTLTCESNSSFSKFAWIVIIAQSYQFLYRIYYVHQARIKEHTERTQKNIRMDWFQPISNKKLKRCKFYAKK